MNFLGLGSQEIKNGLLKLDLSWPLREFVQSSFRLRVKELCLQIRSEVPAFLVDCESEQAQILREFSLELAFLGFDNLKLEYKNCCQTNCLGCQTFSKRPCQKN